MKKIKFSLVEKKLICSIIVVALIQFLIVFSFIHMLHSSQQININDTKQIDITVADIYYVRVPKENWLVVVAGSTKYLFMSRATFEDASVNELYNSISKGDRLSLIYYESDSIIFDKINVIVAAKSENEIYRTLEEYNRGKQGVPVFVSIVFSIIESGFVGIVFIHFWINHKIMKGLCRKIKNHHF